MSGTSRHAENSSNLYFFMVKLEGYTLEISLVNILRFASSADQCCKNISANSPVFGAARAHRPRFLVLWMSVHRRLPVVVRNGV